MQGTIGGPPSAVAPTPGAYSDEIVGFVDVSGEHVGEWVAVMPHPTTARPPRNGPRADRTRIVRSLGLATAALLLIAGTVFASQAATSGSHRSDNGPGASS